jgi:hypothetical protein
MTLEIFTFYKYLQTYSSNDITLLKELLKDKIDLLPDRITSSKKIMMCLNINSRNEYCIFKKVYLDYFKLKLIKL